MIMGGISNDETTVEERRQAFHEEWRTFYKRSTPTNKIRELMGVPRIVGQDHEWNLIRSDVRLILRNRDVNDIDEQIKIADEIEKLESIRKFTNEPRRFTEWFRCQFYENSNRKERIRETRAAEYMQKATTSGARSESEEINAHLEELDKGEGVNRKNFWEVVVANDERRLNAGKPIIMRDAQRN